MTPKAVAAEETVEEVVTTKPVEEKLPMPEPELRVETEGKTESTALKLTDMTRDELLNPKTRIRFVYFPYDKYEISPSYINVLYDLVKVMDKYPDLYVKIGGHTDAVGSQAYNLPLSENRAQSVKEFLLIQGLEPDRIRTEAFGKLQPYATNLTDEGRALNRRVEFSFGVMK
jgi:outer membrane protein OmpA-like peptidoglycan-associated protein